MDIKAMELEAKTIRESLNKLDAKIAEAKAPLDRALEKFKTILSKHGDYASNANVRRDDGHILANWPHANREWACSMMKACIEFCSEPVEGRDSPWPEFRSGDNMTLRIYC